MTGSPLRWFRLPGFRHRDPVPDAAVPVAHLQGPGTLRVEGGRLLLAISGGRRVRLDPARLEVLHLYGAISVTADALKLVTRHQVSLSFLSHGGQHLVGRLEPPGNERILTRMIQHRVLAEPRFRHPLALQTVTEKIHSQSAAARHYQRQGRSAATTTIKNLEKLSDRCSADLDEASLRGIEGAASAAWFALFGQLLHSPWRFPRRSRRPPRDPVNALLSLGYTLLVNRLTARIEATGLDQAAGLLHTWRPGRPALACDLAEPLRVPTVDRWVIQLCNQNRLSPEAFQDNHPEAGVRLVEHEFGSVVAGWEEHWRRGQWDAVLDRSIREFTHELRRLGSQLPEIRQWLSPKWRQRCEYD